MPDMNGLEETRILKKLMPAVPVIIYTAHSDPVSSKKLSRLVSLQSCPNLRQLLS